MDNILLYVLSGLFGIILGIGGMLIYFKSRFSQLKKESVSLITDAKEKAENIILQANLEGKNTVIEMKLNAEKEVDKLKKSVVEQENKLLRQEDNLNFRLEKVSAKEEEIADKKIEIEDRINELEKTKIEIEDKKKDVEREYERVAHLTATEAREELMSKVSLQMEKETLLYIKEQEEEAKSKAAEIAKNIIGLAISRYSNEEVAEKTVSVVQLPNEDMKGRIIGREGRNIRAIEQATGVDLIIDDTPECITVSCFDPIRREIAKNALEYLIKDGRIQPGRIEEVVYKMRSELDEVIQKAGEEAIFKLGLGRMDKELIKLVGRLKYRYSYGQNGLQHSIEVAHITGMMAAELGLNQTLAKRAGLLHDIGKAIDFELEGSHVELGKKFAKKYGENEVILNAIESHHGDVEATSVIATLVAAADALSAARPGARHESFESYINRLEKLEEIATSFDGIESSYAIQAGREIRVMAIPDKIDDLGCLKVAREIKEKIESELTYPGQIKVTVIREVRAQEIAK